MLTLWFMITMGQLFGHRPLRILMVVERFPWCTKQVIINQYIGLYERGHDIYIYSEKRMKDAPMDEGFLERYDIPARTYYEKLPPDLHTYDIIIFQYGNLAKKFCQIKKEYGLKAKIVTFFRGFDITADEQIRPGEYEELFKIGDLFLPICEYFKFRLLMLGCDPAKVAVQYSGVNCLYFSFKQKKVKRHEPVHIISVGRLIEKKGFTCAVRAVIEVLRRTNVPIKYTIVGDGRQRRNIEDLIKRYKLEKYINLVGWKTQGELAALLESAHICMLPCTTSKNGTQDAPINVLKEAMLCGLPVISTYHGGIIEIVEPNVSGYLVPERDVHALARALQYLVENPNLWAKMGAAGRKRVRNLFDMEKLNATLEERLYAVVEQEHI